MNLGNQWGLTYAKTSFSTGSASGLPLANVFAIDIRNKKLFAAIDIQANLAQMSMSDWIDEPCKRDDFIWKRSIGGAFKNINCASISHRVNYFVTPTGYFQQILGSLRSAEVDITPTVVEVEFTRYTNNGRRLKYRIQINPEEFGVERDASNLWGANSWHRAFIQKDKKKTEFIVSLTRWAEEIQNRIDNAFEKNQGAFQGMPEFMSYFNKPKNEDRKSVEERLKNAKDLFDKNLITEKQYNEQVGDILNN